MKLMTKEKLNEALSSLDVMMSRGDSIEDVYTVYQYIVTEYFTNDFEFQRKIINWICSNIEDGEQDLFTSGWEDFLLVFLTYTVITKENIHELFNDNIELMSRYGFLFIDLQEVSFDTLIENAGIVDWNIVVDSQDLTEEQYNQISKKQNVFKTYEEYKNSRTILGKYKQCELL